MLVFSFRLSWCVCVCANGLSATPKVEESSFAYMCDWPVQTQKRYLCEGLSTRPPYASRFALARARFIPCLWFPRFLNRASGLTRTTASEVECHGCRKLSLPPTLLLIFTPAAAAAAPSLAPRHSALVFVCRSCVQVNPGVQGWTVAAHRRNDAKNVPQHHAQLRSDANIEEVRGVQLHRKAGKAGRGAGAGIWYCSMS